MTRARFSFAAAVLLGGLASVALLACPNPSLRGSTCSDPDFTPCGEPGSGYVCCGLFCVEDGTCDKPLRDAGGGVDDGGSQATDAGLAGDAGFPDGGDAGCTLDGGVFPIYLETPSVGFQEVPGQNVQFSWQPIALDNPACQVTYKLYEANGCPADTENMSCMQLSTSSPIDLQGATSHQESAPATRRYWQVRAFVGDTQVGASMVWYFEPHAVRSDFDGDGASDPVVRMISQGSQAYLSMYAKGPASMPTTPKQDCPAFGQVMTVADFDGDSKAELVSLNPCPTTPGVINEYRGLNLDVGDGAAACANPKQMITVGDMDLDGDEDVAVLCSDGVKIYAGALPGATPAVTPVMTAGPSLLAALGDVNGDGRADLGVVDSSGKLFIFFGRNLDGTQLNPSGLTFPSGALVEEVVATGDSNKNGRGEFAVLSAGSVNIYEWQPSSSTFTPINSAIPAPGCLDIYPAGDMDGDGSRDVLCRTDGSPLPVLQLLTTPAGGLKTHALSSCADSLMTTVAAAGGFRTLGGAYVVIACDNATGSGMPEFQWWRPSDAMANEMGGPAPGSQMNGARIASPL